jgi:DNA-binding NtrC family response regulator
MSGERVLLVEDDQTQRQVLARLLSLSGVEVVQAATVAQALAALSQTPADVVLSDLRLPDGDGMTIFSELRRRWPETCFILVTAYASVRDAVAAMKQGVFHYLAKPVDAGELRETVTRALEMVSLRRENLELRRRLLEVEEQARIVGQAPALKAALEVAYTVGPSEATVLVRGETGTGKELFANLIHALSPRRNRPLIKMNCAAIPENLLEDELFGHVKGAFTGAHADRKGRFEAAEGGSIFMDEVAEMPTRLQVKLLRVLQEREFERVGSTEVLSADVRLIAASSQNLEKMVEEGTFREELYYRINVVPVFLPPLRERREDILVLAQHFLHRFAERYERNVAGFTPEAARVLRSYDWPGNVRQLENLIERAVLLTRGEQVDVGDLELSGPRRTPVVTPMEQLLDEQVPLEEVERRLIALALARAGGNQTQAARLLHLSRRTLQYRMEKYNLQGDRRPVAGVPEAGAEEEKE